MYQHQDRTGKNEEPTFGLLGQPLLDTLERMGYGGILFDRHGNALHANASAVRILQREIDNPPDPPTLDWIRVSANRLLARGKARYTRAADVWVIVPRVDGRNLVLHSVEIGSGRKRLPGRVIIAVDLYESAHPQPEVLNTLFGLTQAEARLAVYILQGESPAEIAHRNGTSIATVRSQLASVFAKTQTSRQAELVSLLARVSILP